MMDLTPQPWMTDAACVDHPTLTPDAWFPTEKKISDANRDAIAVCEGCPVRADCALFHARHQCEGIWGGSIRRQTWHSPGATQRRQTNDAALRAKTGERERAVMHLHRAGLSSAQIAAHVHISPASIRRIIRRVNAREAAA